jgi:hypothetical protein
MQEMGAGGSVHVDAVHMVRCMGYYCREFLIYFNNKSKKQNNILNTPGPIATKPINRR